MTDRSARMHPRERLLLIIRESQQLVNDIEWWNANRLDAAPFDVGADKVRLHRATECLSAWDAGDMKEVDRLVKLLESEEHT